MSKLNIYDRQFSERMRLIAEELFKGNNSKFSKAVGVSQPSLTKWLNSGADTSRSNLIKIVEATGVSLEWLVLGQGDMYSSCPLGNTPAGVAMIPSYMSFDVSASVKNFDNTVQPDSIEPYALKCLEKIGVKAKNLAVFWASDDSMYPTIGEEDKLLLDMSVKEAKNDRIYLIQNGSSVWIKRVKFLWDHIELVSDNKEKYEPIVLSLEEAKALNILGQVVHISKCVI